MPRQPLILLATTKRDITTDFIVIELRRRGVPFVRLNTEDVAQLKVQFTPGSGWRLGDLDLSRVTAGYYRRPMSPVPASEITDVAVAAYVSAEWSAVLRSLWNVLEGRWLNSPFAILRAEDKPRQLEMAMCIGLDLPSTLVTNDIDAAQELTHSRTCVGKPLRQALIQDEEVSSVLFTHRVGKLARGDAEALAMAPVILQEEILKRRDIRATVVGDRVFAAAIESQASEESRTDWRRGSRADLPHTAIRLPDSTEAKLVELTRRLGLKYGAADLIEGKDGRLWFVEINPNGQWAWIEKLTGLPIAGAIADLLVAGS